MTSPLEALTQHGQSPWIDYITRRFLGDGELAELVGQGVRGVTSNPTIFQQAFADDEEYERQLQQLADRGLEAYDAFVELAQEDIRNACDVLAPVHAAADDRSRDGWVSLEVDPRLAHDAQATVREAVRLHELVDRPNLMVKIPATEQGLEAIEQVIGQGVPVNVTLLFSLERHLAATRAYVRGLHHLLGAGGDPSSVASVASFFVSRVDTEADRRLAEVGGDERLKGTLAIANAKLAYQTYLEVFRGSEWKDLAAEGASPQRCLWASTSAKDPAYRDVIYVEELIGPETVNTMPPATIRAFQDHGKVARTLDRGVDDAMATFEAFAAAGVDYQEIVRALEREGVQKFTDSFDELLSGLAGKLERVAAR